MLRTEFQFRCTEHSVNLNGTPRFTVANDDHGTYKVELGSMFCPTDPVDSKCRTKWTDRECDHVRSLRAGGTQECHVMTCWNYAGKWFAKGIADATG